MATSRDQLQSLLEVVLATEPAELDCEQFFEHVAAYLDSCVPAGEMSPLMKQVQQHLQVCPECLEAFEALKCARGPDSEDQPAAALPSDP